MFCVAVKYISSNSMNNFFCILYYSLFRISHQDNCKQFKILEPVWVSHTLHLMQERRIRQKYLFSDEIFFDFPWMISKILTQNVWQECFVFFINMAMTWPFANPQYTAYMKSTISRFQIFFRFPPPRSRWRPFSSDVFRVFSSLLQLELSFKRHEGCQQMLPKLQHSMIREFRVC